MISYYNVPQSQTSNIQGKLFDQTSHGNDQCLVLCVTEAEDTHNMALSGVSRCSRQLHVQNVNPHQTRSIIDQMLTCVTNADANGLIK